MFNPPNHRTSSRIITRPPVPYVTPDTDTPPLSFILVNELEPIKLAIRIFSNLRVSTF